MNLYDKFNQDIVTAMKQKDKDKLTTLRLIKGAMQLEHINNKKEENEELLVDVISKQIKLRNDSILEFEKGNRDDLIEKTNREIEILREYLPKQLSCEELEQIINDVFNRVKPNSPKDMGILMKEITPLIKGKADMKLVSEKIKERINSI